jgi:hypothetical protein
MGDEEVVGGGEEVVVVRRDKRREGLLGEPRVEVLAPHGEEVVADEDVVDLLDAADVGDHPRLDLLVAVVGEGIRWKSDGERGDGLRCRFTVDEDDVVGGGERDWRVGSRGASGRVGRRAGGGDLAAEPGALVLAWEGGDAEVKGGARTGAGRSTVEAAYSGEGW